MKKKTIYEIKGLYRDSFRITGFEFGKGKKSLHCRKHEGK